VLAGEQAAVVAGAYDAVAATYDSDHSGKRERAEDAWVRRWLRGRLMGDVLDVACGTGLLLDLLDVSPFRYLGIDVSEGMLSVARNKRPAHRFEQADMTTFQTSGADTIVSLFASIAHVEDQSVMPQQIARSLRPAGQVFCMGFGERRALRQPAPVAPWWPTTLADIDRYWRPHFRSVTLQALWGPRADRLTWLPVDMLIGYLVGESRRIHPDSGVFVCIEAHGY
jgi:ubiquinone/menaquinone biosynthesis C-methylase UbiE